jgi:hypothetical protein
VHAHEYFYACFTTARCIFNGSQSQCFSRNIPHTLWDSYTRIGSTIQTKESELPRSSSDR